MTLHCIHTTEHDAATKYAVWIKTKKNKTTENMKICFPIELSKMVLEPTVGLQMQVQGKY